MTRFLGDSAYRGESCLQKYAACQSAFPQLLFSTTTLPLFSCHTVICQHLLPFFFFLIPFCSHHSRPCPAPQQSMRGVPNQLGTCRQHLCPFSAATFARRESPKALQNRHCTSLSMLEVQQQSSCSSLPLAALPVPPGCSSLGAMCPLGRGEGTKTLIPLPSAGAWARGSHPGGGKDSCPRHCLSGATWAAVSVVQGVVVPLRAPQELRMLRWSHLPA